MQLFFLLLIGSYAIPSTCSQNDAPILSLKQLCARIVAQLYAKQTHTQTQGPELPTECVRYIRENYNYQSPIQWKMPKIVALNSLYCFTQSESSWQRMDMLGRAIIERLEEGELESVSDNGRLVIFNHGSNKYLYDFKSGNKVSFILVDKIWIINNVYLIDLKQDIVNIWKMSYIDTVHKDSLTHVKQCYPFPEKPYILTLHCLDNRDTYTLYNCAQNKSCATHDIPESFDLCITHPELLIFAATYASQRHNLYIYDPQKTGNSYSYLAHSAPLSTACFIPKTNLLVTSTQQPDNVIRMWDIHSNKHIALYSLDANPPIQSLWFLPTGLYAQDANNTCHYWHHITIKTYRMLLEKA